MRRTIRCTWILVALLACTGTLLAQGPPEKPQAVSERLFQHPDLTIPAFNDTVGQLPAPAAEQARARLAGLQAPEDSARVDRRSNRFVTLTPATPLVPGSGVGNALTWAELKMPAAPKASARAEAVRAAFAAFVRDHQADLDLDLDEMSLRVTDYGDGTLYQVFGLREIDGIAVRGSYVTGVVSHGNLALMSAHQWGDFNGRSNRPQLTADEARFAAEGHLLPLLVTREWGKPERVYLTMANGNGTGLGNGYRYQLAWSVKANVDGDGGNFEVLLDAHDGELLAFEDTNEYAEVKGGVLPVSNDGIVPDGVEQAGWPMPFATTSLGTTDTGGNVPGGGSFNTDLAGTYVNINDNCGSSALAGSDTIDFGTSGGTDCTTPSGGPAGNTHASRTGFYELNKIIEMARGQLPSNSWLQQTLTSNMNINSTCNAYWNGTVNFYRSGGGCSNTGELAGVFDHEWGHGLDANDATPGIASPSGEGIADIYTALRLNNSCIGRNFRPGIQCGGYGDPCIDCTGVRDIDYLKRQSSLPHDFTWRNANCGSTVHCIGYVYSEAVWSLWKRKLQAAPYGYDNNTAHEIVNRLTFIGAGNTGNWFSGSPPFGGCAGGSGYLNYLAADDDNGNINDGTPHMQAIYDAFNDQEIACDTPTVQDSGCAGTPTAAPSVTAVSANMGVNLSWTSVAGATEYEVFRTEGVFACDFGKVKVATTTGTTFNDTGLQNGRDYSYIVIAKGAADSCFGPASGCATQQPGKIPCSVDPDCDDALFCNGAETCVAGFCENGTDPCAANPTWTCDEVGDVCVPECTVDADCDDGAFCNGAEVCNAGTCAAGSDPCPGQCCDEASTSCGISNDPQDAAYDGGLGAPACPCGSSCDSQGLLDGRGNIGPEPNQPNTIDSCTDGGSGTYHSDESNDRIVVTNLSGLGFTEGDTVEVAATVWAWSTGSSDSADFYYTADADNPSWTYIGSVVPPAGGAHTLTQQYVLPAGSLQAVRVNFRYSGTVGSCTTGGYDDRDDLVFAVSGGGCSCTVDADCDDGLFCNGAETCNGCTCEAGMAPNCNDGVSCTDDSCNEGTDSCDNVANDANCDNGLWCDGAETCDAVNDCQAGTPVDCNDGVGCTVDSCNEGTDSCDNTPDDGSCSNGQFCDGVETCDPVADCQPGPGDPCGANETCDEVGDVCVPDACFPKGASCVADAECCSNKCKGKSGSQTCK